MNYSDTETSRYEILEIDAASRVITTLPELVRSLYSAVHRHPSADGVPIGQIKLLGFLYENAPCSLRAVASGLGLSMAATSEGVNRLVDAELVRREPNPVDRRQVILSMTDRAWHMASDLRQVRLDQVAWVFDQLAPGESEILARGLELLTAAMRSLPDELTATNADSGSNIDSTTHPGAGPPTREPITTD